MKNRNKNWRKDDLWVTTSQQSGYDKIVKLNGTAVACYSKKKMKSMFAGEKIPVQAECAAREGGERIGMMRHNGEDFPLRRYGSSNRFAYAEKGYVQSGVGRDQYVALMKNVLPLRLVLIAAVAAAILLVCLLSQGETQKLLGIDPNAGAAQEAPVTENGEPGIAIPGRDSISLKAGETAQEVDFSNPENNPCYFVISLFVEDGSEEGELLYQSQLVEPGKGIYEIEMNRPLDAGEYTGRIQYDSYGLEDQTPMNGASVKVKLVVE